MRIDFAKSTYTFVIITLIAIINIGCNLSILEQSQNTVAEAKPQENIFTVVDTTDPKNPALMTSINLPFRVSQNNNVVLSGKHAYVTSENHLHVIDVSNPQQPSYMASIAFPDRIGKARVSGNHVYVASKQKIYLVDVSNRLQPVNQSMVKLHQANVIREFDIHKSYLYIMDIHDYLHIYSLDNGNAQFVESVGTISPSSLVGVRAKGTEVEQILMQHRHSTDPGWAALSDRTDLLEISGRYEKVRVTDNNLVLISYRYPNRDITIVWGKNQVRPYMWEWLEHYNLEGNYLAYLYLTGKKTLTRGKPTDAYVERSNKIQFAMQDQWSETIDIEENNLLGPITDFQISQNLLYVVNAKGFLSVIDLDAQAKHRFISATTLQEQHPISIAVGKNYAYVLATPEESQK
ncbi:hypothetical protein J4G08_17805 [Candidatus Poribacteria bacterium]|nr:hypothetical protein [Candidatus Poribacteria bacterium]